MDFKQSLIRCWPGVPLPAAAAVASTEHDAIAAQDVEVDFYTAMFLDAQGKLQSIQEILAELRNDDD